MRVPFIDLKRTMSLIREPVLASWEQCVANTEFVGGPTVAKLEAALAEQLGAAHAVCCSTGTDALLIALQALGVGPGSKVALPNLTFWATYEAVAQLGATPVLVDVDPDHLQMDLAELKLAHEKVGFDAAILVHLMGWASPQLGELRSFCQDADIPLLEDGAQSFGVEVGGRSVYAGARASTLSFYPAKVLGGCMDGGAVLTDDQELADRIRRLCNHGRSTHFSYSDVGWNSRMGGIGASWLLEMLGNMAAILEQRRAHEQAYHGLLSEQSALKVFGPPAGVQGNGYLSVCTLAKHDLAATTKRLADAGVSVGRVYPETLDQQGPAKKAPRVSELPHGRAFCRKVVNLPLFYGLATEEAEYAARSLIEALQAKEAG